MLKWMSFLSVALVVASPAIAQSNNADLPDGPGKPIVQKMCTGCHSLSTVTAKRATKEQWSNIVQQMVSRGADGTDEEIATVIDYLAKNFPPAKDDKSTPPAPQSSVVPAHLGQPSYDSLLTISKADEDALLRRWHSAR